jgi:hypothetical protein
MLCCVVWLVSGLADAVVSKGEAASQQPVRALQGFCQTLKAALSTSFLLRGVCALCKMTASTMVALTAHHRRALRSLPSAEEQSYRHCHVTAKGNHNAGGCR